MISSNAAIITHEKISEDTKIISIIMPAMNEESNLPRAYLEITEIFSKLGTYNYEVIVIDNDSTDGTGEVCSEICYKDERWKYLKFSRNFTVEHSIAAGLKYASGDAVIILFSDLQDPPELIPTFIEKWKEGYDVVCGVLNNRADGSWWKNIGARLAYTLLNRLSDINLPQNIADFRLMSRQVVDAINCFDERNRYFRGLAHWVGFRTYKVPYDRRPRLNGKSATSFFYLIDITIRALTNFSIAPLRLFSTMGLLILGGTLIYMLVTLAQFILNKPIPGLTTVYFLLLSILAFISLGIGTLGEYIGRIYIETKRRPLWIVEKTINISIPREYRVGK